MLSKTGTAESTTELKINNKKKNGSVNFKKIERATQSESPRKLKMFHILE